MGPGAPFTLGETTPCTNIVVGTVDHQPFTAFEYAHEVQAFFIDLAGGLPFLEVRPRSIADDPRYATAVLSPQLITKLLAGPALSWRILGHRLVGWRNGTLDVDLIEPAVITLETIKEAIPLFVWNDYATPSDT